MDSLNYRFFVLELLKELNKHFLIICNEDADDIVSYLDDTIEDYNNMCNSVSNALSDIRDRLERRYDLSLQESDLLNDIISLKVPRIEDKDSFIRDYEYRAFDDSLVLNTTKLDDIFDRAYRMGI